MRRPDARNAVCGLACVVLVGAIAFILTACGSEASSDTESSASDHARSGNGEVLPEQKRAQRARDRKRHLYNSRERWFHAAANAELKDARTCLLKAGFPAATSRSYGVGHVELPDPAGY